MSRRVLQTLRSRDELELRGFHGQSMAPSIRSQVPIGNLPGNLGNLWEPMTADGNPCKTEEGNPGISRGNPGDFCCLTSHQPFLYWRALSLSCSHVVVDFFAWGVRGRLIAIPVVLFMFNFGANSPYLATRPLPSLSVADLQVSCFSIGPEHKCLH